MSGLNYLLQTNLYLLLFMGFYVLVLRNETFFRQNRFFLNTSIFLSFLIPFINSDWFRDLFITQKVREAALMPSQMLYETVIVGIREEESSLTIADAILWIYLAGAVLLSIRFLFRLAFMKSNLRVKKGSAFSFFNMLAVDREMPEADTIISHEKVHMRQWHSADIIFIELAAIINWFNPVMYLYKKEIRHIHEFIADEEAATLMESKSDYALLLFSTTLGVDPLHLSNNFFNKSLLKRRILMLNKTKSRSTGLWKYGFSAPLFILMLIVSAAMASSESNVLSIDEERSINSIENFATIPLSNVIQGKSNSNNTQFPNIVTTEVNKSLLANPGDLKKHISSEIKYSAAAKAANAVGYIQVNFLVKNNTISGVEITKSLHPDLDKDILNAFATFKSQIAIPDNEYLVTITYLDTQRPVNDQMTDKVPKNVIYAKNNLGDIIVLVDQNGNPKPGWSVAVSRPNPSTGKLERIGYDDSSIQNKSPEFPGGPKAWRDYLVKSLKYPAVAKSKKVEGRVIVNFTVEKDGSIEEIKILRGIGSGADEEAVRVVAQSPKWTPGTIDGQPAKIAFTVPINFSLGEAVNTVGNSTKQQNSIALNEVVIGNDNSIKDFSSVEILPEFAGGMAGWGKYLQANLKYPDEARSKNITGRVIMSFIVEKDGSLSDIKVLRGIGGGADEEAVRVLKNAPNWKPGILDGRPVRVAYTMPIFFQLSSKTDGAKAGELKPGD